MSSDPASTARATARSPIPPPDELASRLGEALPRLLEAEPVRVAYLFGSAASGRTTPLSDVDIALVVDDGLEPGPKLGLILRLKGALSDCCDIIDADIVVINDAPLVFQGNVLSTGIPVYARDQRDRIDYEVKTRLLYFDYLPAHRALQDAFFARLRERGLDGKSR